MKQINIRVSEEEYTILGMIAKRQGITITSLFRTAIYDNFETWKILQLLNLYTEGQIRFKEIVQLSGWSYASLIKKFSELGLEPPTIDEAENRAETIVSNIKPASILKNWTD